MIKEITIRNYKSIHDLTMELGHVNVLIGENGCGKTNILEAVAMLGAGLLGEVNVQNLYNIGVRVTKPSLTVSSFLGEKSKKSIELEVSFRNSNDLVESKLLPTDSEDIFSTWNEHSGHLAKQFNSFTPEQKKIIAEMNRSLGKLEKLRQKANKNSELESFENNFFHTLRKRIEDSFVYGKLTKFLIFDLQTDALRGVGAVSKVLPLGIHGEGLDILLSDFSKGELDELRSYGHLISWMDDFFIDQADQLKFKGHKLGRSNSILYFRDKFMRKNNNVFAAENSNEGVLHILFYLALFISKKTPQFFAIDNIETALNPKLCRTLMTELAALAVKHEKQALITTHNPAILDGMNLHDDTQRLFVISRSDEGHTRARRIKLKPEVEGTELKLSEMWMRGYLGGLPDF